MEKEPIRKPEQATSDPGTRQTTTRVESAMPPPFNPTASPQDPGLGKASRQGIDESGGGGMMEPAPAPKPKAEDRKPKAAFSEEDAILGGLVTAGAGEATATQDDRNATERGVAASEKLARTDLVRIRTYLNSFITVGRETSLPPALLAAIASRESRCGNALDGAGTGDNGNGYGIMQVDRRYHDIADSGGPGGIAHVRQGAEILLSMLSKVRKRFPQWTPAQQLRGAVAAYNFGDSNVQSWEGLDRGTSHDDYSADTWARARYYAGLKAFNGTADIPATELPLPGKETYASPPVGHRPAVPAGRLIAEAVGAGGVNHPDDVAAVLERMLTLGVVTEAEAKDSSDGAVETYVIRYQGMTMNRADGRIDPGGKTESNLIRGVTERPGQPPKAAGGNTPDTGAAKVEVKAKPEKEKADGRVKEMEAAYWRLMGQTPATPEGAQSILRRGDTFAGNAFADLCRMGRWDMLHALYSELWAFDRDWMAREIAARLTGAEIAALPKEVRQKLWEAMDAGWTGVDEYALMEKVGQGGRHTGSGAEEGKSQAHEGKDGARTEGGGTSKRERRTKGLFVISDANAYLRDDRFQIFPDKKVIPRWTEVRVEKEAAHEGVAYAYAKATNGPAQGWTAKANLYSLDWRAEDHEEEYRRVCDGYYEMMAAYDPEDSRDDLVMSGDENLKKVIDVYFANSTDVDGLSNEGNFKRKLKDMLAFWEQQGIGYSVESAVRHPLRSTVFNYSIKVAAAKSENIVHEANAVCRKYGIPIEWAHRRADGSIDLASSRSNAAKVKNVFGLKNDAARGVTDFGGKQSNHNRGKAVDINLSIPQKVTIMDNGKTYEIEPGQETGTYIENVEGTPLSRLGKDKFGITRSVDTDAIHWSINGN